MTERWLSKANTYAAAYKQVINSLPSRHNVIFALCVAQWETHCGDSLNGNWGGTTFSQLAAADRMALHNAGLVPSNPDDLPKAQALLGSRSNEILGRDFSNGGFWYWIWFFKPSNPIDGATYFVKVLVKERSTCQHILDDDNGSIDDLVRAMYASKYFSGTYSPHSSVTYRGEQITGDEANIRSYRDQLLAIEPIITSALNGWESSLPGYDLSTTTGVQEALTFIAAKLNRPDLDPKGIDGNLGPNTKLAIENFQTFIGIAPDAIVGLDTTNAFIRILSGISASSDTEPSPPES